MRGTSGLQAPRGTTKAQICGVFQCARFKPLPHSAWTRINTLIVSTSTGKDKSRPRPRFF